MITFRSNAIPGTGKVWVTFSMSAAVCKDHLYLVGWFDEWDESVYVMERTTDGYWSLTLELDAGREYQYRFRTADGSSLSDPSLPAGALYSRRMPPL